jgi:protein O-mannosyl-transferase
VSGQFAVFNPENTRSTRRVRASKGPTASTRRDYLLPVAGLVGAALLSYHNSFSGPFVLDDVPSIAANPSLTGPWSWGEVLWPAVDGGATVNGRPVVNLTLALNHALGGLQVGGYHVFNLLIHGLAGVLLWALAGRTFRQPRLKEAWGPAAGALAWALAALWLVHPLQTESVTYIIQRAEALAGLWYLLTLYAFARGAADGGSRGWLGVSVAACWLGMATKEVMVSAPLLVWYYDRTFVAGSFREAWQRRRVYYTALVCSWVLLAGLVAASAGRGGTAGLGAGVGVWSYALTQCEALIRYLGLVFWPSPLVFDYGRSVAGGLGEVWWQAAVLVGLVAATIWAGVRRPAWGFVGLWFFAVLAPSSSVVPVASQTMAEHRMYLALAAPLALLVLGLYRWLGRFAWVVGGGLAVIASGLTMARNADYADAHTLWADTVAKRPDNARARHNLSLAEADRGNLAEAERQVRAALALEPDSPELPFTLGLLLARQGRGPEAIASYERALVLDPRYAAAHNNLGNALFAAGRVAEAGGHYAEAVRLQPGYAGARNSYGNWLLEQGRAAEALNQLEEAVRLDPGLADAHFNAGNACLDLGRPEAARAWFEEALRLQPTLAAAHNNLGNLLLGRDDVAGAMQHYADAVRLDKDYFAPRRSLAFLLLQLDRPAEARPHLEILAQLKPNDTEIARALAWVRSQGR